MKTTDTTDRRVLQRAREESTLPRARSHILDLLVLTPQGKMEVCHRIKGLFRARRLVRRVCHPRLEERLLAIMLDGAPRTQSNSSSNDRMMKLRGTVK